MYQKIINKKKGFTLVELIAAIAITAIVGTLTTTLFILPQTLLKTGGNLSNVQFNLRMISDRITNEVRLASGVEILPPDTIIPTITNNDKYIYINNSENVLVVSDQNGDHSLFYADALNINFTVNNTFKTLAFTISGNQSNESFTLSSSVAALNLPSDQLILDNSGASDGSVIKIENNLPAVEVTGLYFVMQSPNEGKVNTTFFRTLTAFNYSGSYSYSFVNGELPPGLILNTTGTISGTPTTIGSFIFSIRLTDNITSTVRTFLVNIVSESNVPVPIVSELTLSGILQNGYLVTGSYLYMDPNNSPELGSTTIWYRMDDVIGTNKSEIARSASTATLPSSYTLTASDVGKYIAFQVLPKSTDERLGIPVTSSPLRIVDNQAPTAESVEISPDKPKIGNLLVGNYIYDDFENNTEAGTTFQWYYSTKSNSALIKIIGATNDEYLTVASDVNNYFYFEVTPRALTGNKNGDSVISANVKIGN